MLCRGALEASPVAPSAATTLPGSARALAGPRTTVTTAPSIFAVVINGCQGAVTMRVSAQRAMGPLLVDAVMGALAHIAVWGLLAAVFIAWVAVLMKVVQVCCAATFCLRFCTLLVLHLLCLLSSDILPARSGCRRQQKVTPGGCADAHRCASTRRRCRGRRGAGSPKDRWCRAGAVRSRCRAVTARAPRTPRPWHCCASD